MFTVDRNAFGGGVLIYFKEDIPCKELKSHAHTINMEGICREVCQRISNWHLFGGYNNEETNIWAFLGALGPILDQYMSKLENFLLIGDFL